MLRSRAAMRPMISRAKSGLSFTSARKRGAVTGTSVQSVTAVAVAPVSYTHLTLPTNREV